MTGRPRTRSTQVVAVRADERETAIELGRAARGERGAELVRDAGGRGIRRSLRLRPPSSGSAPRTESAHSISGSWSAPAIAAYAAASGAASSAARARRASITSRAERDELVVPDIERRQRVAADAARLRGLQQGGALLEHPVVVGEHAGEPRGALDEQLIGESAARRRVAAHDLQVFGSEQHDLGVARQLGGLHRRAVDPRLVRALPVELRLEQHAALAVGEPRADDRGIRAVAHHRRIVRDAVRAERGEEGDGLGEVRLALTVAADEHVRTRAERDSATA